MTLELSNRVWLSQGAGFARKFPLELDSGNKFVVGCLFYLCQGFSIFAGKSFLKRFTVLSLSHWVKLYLTALEAFRVGPNCAIFSFGWGSVPVGTVW